MKRFTLEDIGKLAGVSRSTVSRVINNSPQISPEVKARVEKVIRETGYAPNSAARSLASSQTRILGLIIPSILQTTFSDPYYSELLAGITHACNETDYTIALYLFQSQQQEQQTIQRIVSSGMVDGLIVTTNSAFELYGNLLSNHSTPVIQLGSTYEEDSSAINYIDVDNIGGAYLATAHLIQQGYKRIGQIAVPDNSAGRNRDIGYRRALSEYGYPLNADLIVNSANFVEHEGYKAMQSLLSRGVDAVFVQSDLMALGAIRAIREANLQVPDDIAVVGFDDIPAAATFEVPLTTIRQPVFRQGELLIKTLIDVIQTSPNPVRHIVLPVELVVRASSYRAQ